MAALSHSSSKRMYSWWWDSHISPKNSKWLQENLQDMDAKVKQMIKLIEEDADSFARRAEMYYKKRPELMKLVEDFYRAYRALAERYDHATGVIRQAHRTMTEVFPNQVPQVHADDLPAGSISSESDPQTPQMPPPPSAVFDPKELQKHTSGLPASHFHIVKGNGAITQEPDYETGRRGLKQFNDILAVGESASHSKFWEGRSRKGRQFQNAEEKECIVLNNRSKDIKGLVALESDRVTKAEAEILSLKNARGKLEAEKEAGWLQYQHSLEKLSKLESQVLHAQENSHGLNERASKAEAEVQTLKESINELENERQSGLLQYQKCLEKITDMENKILSDQKDAGELKERTTRAETEAESLKHELAKTDAEKEAALQQYKQCSEKLLDLEDKLLQAAEDARRLSERARNAERETELLKLEMARLSEEKEVAALEYQRGLETISSLEHKLSCAEEEARSILYEVDTWVEKLRSSEERCLVLEKSNKDMQSELESLVQKVRSQSEELTEKQKHLGRQIQEEHLRFIEAETAFQTLQNLHSQSQEELRDLVVELRNKAKLLEDMETWNRILQDEICKYKEENDVLNELKLSSTSSMKNLEDEIIDMRDTIQKLEEEVELRVDQRNALQQEIYCLKEELNDLNKKHHAALEQVESVGYDVPRFGSSVKKLLDENSCLKKRCEVEEVERADLLKKIEVMEKLLEKNADLENTLSDLNVKLEAFRRRVKMLKDSYQRLLEEKSSLVAERATLTSQLQVTVENLNKISDKNSFLEISLLDVHAELQGMSEKSKDLEESCLVLDNKNSSLISQTETLVSQLSISHRTLENLAKRCSELEEKNLVTESEMELALEKKEQLLVSLHVEREEHSKFLQYSKSHLADRDMQIHLLQEYGRFKQKEYEELADRAVTAGIEILVLLKCVQDLEEKSMLLLNEHQKLLEASKMSKKLIAKLENGSAQKQIEIKSLTERTETLRIGMHQVLIALDINKEHLCENRIAEDHILLKHVHHQLQKTQSSLSLLCHEKQQLIIEKSVLVTVLGQLKLRVDELLAERNNLNEHIGIQTLHFLVLQEEHQNCLEENEELRSRIEKSDKRVEVLENELENLQQQLSDFKVAHKSLQEETCKAFEERRSLVTKVSCIGENKSELEREVSALLGEMLSQTIVTLIYKNILFESLAALREVMENMDKLSFVNKELDGRLKIMDERLENLQMDNSNLKESLEKSNFELRSVESVNDHLKSEIENEKELLLQREIEVLLAKEILSVLRNEKTDLQNVVEDLDLKYDEARMILEVQENQIDQLSSEKEHLDGELGRLFHANLKLEFEMMDLCGDLRKIRPREENLSFELEKEKDERNLWEAEATALYGDMQVSAVNESLFKGKIRDLTEAREILENRISSHNTEIKLLKDRLSCLESDNGRLHEQLAAYLAAVVSLKASITSLEKHTVKKIKPNDPNNGEPGDMRNQLHAESCQPDDGDQKATAVAALSECQTFPERISAIEKAVISLKAIPVLNDGPKDGGVKEIQALKSGSDPDQEKNQAKETLEQFTAEHSRSRCGPGTPEVNTEVLMKDIILDEISECSSYGISRREAVESDDYMLKLWETADKDDRVVPTVGKTSTTDTRRGNYGNKSNQSQSAGSLGEKELSADKLEITNKVEEPRERKLIERLDSDAHKLSDLRITVEGLKKKMEINVKGRKGTDIQYETVMGQLEIAEATTKKLFGANRKLIKNAEGGFLSFDGRTATVSDDRGRLSEQARKVSERIGSLQLEVQRIQFFLLQLDEKESKGKPKNSGRSPNKVLLRDYLYGNSARTKQQKRKKAPLFSCVQPS